MGLNLSKLLSSYSSLLFLCAFGIAAITLLSVSPGPVKASSTQVGTISPLASSVTDSAVVLENKNNSVFAGAPTGSFTQQTSLKNLQGSSAGPPAASSVPPVELPAPPPVYYPPLSCSCEPVNLSPGMYKRILCPESASGIACPMP